MEGGGDEERMHEVAPDLNLNGTLEDNDIDDEEQQQEQEQQEQQQDDEPHHGDEDEHYHHQNGGSKDAMVESDPKDSPHGSQGKASGTGLVASGPSSIALVLVLVLESVLWSGFARRRLVWSLAMACIVANALPVRLIEGRFSSAACHGTLPQV